MLFVRSLLPRMFRARRREPALEAADVSQAAAPSAAQAETSPDPALLEFPMDHGLHELHRLRTVESGLLPRPYVRIAAPEALLSAEELPQEAVRLRSAMTAAAGKRLKTAVSRGRPAQAGQAPPPPPALSAQVLVFLSKNKLIAWVLVLPPANGGKELDREMLSAALQAAQVTYGVDEALLDRLPQSEEQYFHLHLAAAGQAPVHGTDGSVEELFARQVQRSFETNERGQVDYTSLNLVQNVAEGEAICRISSPTKGQEGRSVLNQALPARDGKTARVPKGRNTALNEAGTELVASIAGDVSFNGQGFDVQPLLVINGNVDYSTGNIKFLGDVHIHGDVCCGFKVWAKGSVTIDGVVEASTVEAGGDVVVAKGVQGNEQAMIRSLQNVYAKYLEKCSVFARGDLQADCIINCDVYCDGTVQVRSGRGKIIGGSIRAGREVSAGAIGTRSEQTTLVMLGGRPCEEYERRFLEAELQALRAEAERIELQPESPSKQRGLSTLRLKINLNKTKQRQLHQEEASFEGGQLVFDIAHPGTEIIIGSAARRLNMEFQMSTARLEEGEICLF